MADYPSLPIWTDAFIADTMHLDAAETGAYIMLIICAWRSPDCAIPNDDKKLARMARCSDRQWKQLRETVLGFWALGDDGMLRQKRLTSVRENVEKTVAQRRESGARGGHAKALKNNGPPVANASDLPQQTASKSLPTKTKTKTKEESADDAGARLVSEIWEAVGLGKAHHVPDGWLDRNLRLEVERWRQLLPDAEILQTVKTVAQRLHAPPNSPAYFEKPMQEAAHRLSRPPLEGPKVTDISAIVKRTLANGC